MTQPIRLGTRGSPLALAQAREVAALLRVTHGWDESTVEIVPITTTGDVIQDRPLADIGGKALWTKELDACLAEGRTDLSVHSMKDVETIRPNIFAIAAMLRREDARDRLIGPARLADLREGAVVGTSSPRRGAQILARRPDIEIVPIRGNVQTRLGKLDRGEVDATLLAAAGLNRLGLGDIGTAIDDMIPAPSQAAVGVEIRSDDARLREIVSAIDHLQTRLCVEAERGFLAAVGGDCRSAVAAHATLRDERIHLIAEILSPRGSEVRGGDAEFGIGDADGPAALARRLLGEASEELRSMFAG